MRDSSRLKFNIVYTPGTARYLQLFVFSLLKWLDCSFRLVANGCSSTEKRLLQALSKRARLEFLEVPSRRMATHGSVLSYLQSLEHSDTFCFMDSDILATGDFLSELAPYLEQCAGVTSGYPVFRQKDEQILLTTHPKMAGRFTQTDKGIYLGCTHLAMYDNRALTQVIQTTGVGFERYGWADVPAQYQDWLAGMGLKKTNYDTGKLLNLLLLAHGERLIFVEPPSLLHIGGISMPAFQEREKQLRRLSRKERIARRARWRIKQLLVSLGIKKPEVQRTVTSGTGPAEDAAMTSRRRIAGHYFNDLLRSLYENLPLPTVPDINDSEVEEKIGMVTADIVALYEEFGGQLER